MALLEPGTPFGDYFLQDKIGEGACGSAHLGLSPQNQQVVLKIIPLTNSFFQKGFKKEYGFLKRFSNVPEVVKVVDQFTSGSYGVLVMEKLDMDLLDFIEGGDIPHKHVKIIFKQVCNAVKALHKRHVAHLDIKPENIFLNNIYSVKLGDFGSCFRWSADNQEKFGISGTTFYCAPEVKQKDSYKPAEADVWSLGILLHVLLTGFWPYSAATQEKLSENINLGKICILKKQIPNNKSLLGLLEEMLQMNPADRPTISDICSSKYLRNVCTEDPEVKVKQEQGERIEKTSDLSTNGIKPNPLDGIKASCSIPNLAELTCIVDQNSVAEEPYPNGDILLSPKGVRIRERKNKHLELGEQKRRTSWTSRHFLNKISKFIAKP